MEHASVIITLSLSILLQIASAITALLLVKTSGFYKPWIFVAAAITLMAVRRVISLKNILISGVYPASSLGPELIALVISILVLAGLILFRPAFLYIREMQEESQNEIKKQNMLMKEANHRIKNNLIMISSLINLKDSTLGDKVDLSDISRQIDAIRIVHEKLYKTEDISYVEVSGYFTDLVYSIFTSFSNREVDIRFELDQYKVHTKTAVTLGLIINEIATNAIKYGFTTDEPPVFALQMKKDAEKQLYSLSISNTGVPFPADIDPYTAKTLGLRLIHTLISQIDGTLELQKQPHPVFTITFPVKA